MVPWRQNGTAPRIATPAARGAGRQRIRGGPGAHTTHEIFTPPPHRPLGADACLEWHGVCGVAAAEQRRDLAVEKERRHLHQGQEFLTDEKGLQARSGSGGEAGAPGPPGAARRPGPAGSEHGLCLDGWTWFAAGVLWPRRGRRWRRRSSRGRRLPRPQPAASIRCRRTGDRVGSRGKEPRRHRGVRNGVGRLRAVSANPSSGPIPSRGGAAVNSSR